VVLAGSFSWPYHQTHTNDGDNTVNPNNCSTCDHIKNPDGGHCYMFADEPTEICMQHTARQARKTLVTLFMLGSMIEKSTSEDNQ